MIVMPRPTGPTDPNATELARRLRKGYPQLARQLTKPARSKAPVNVSRLDRAARQGAALAVAGKVLAAGEITKPVNVYAWQFSKTARKKIEAAGGSCRSLAELAESREKARVVA